MKRAGALAAFDAWPSPGARAAVDRRLRAHRASAAGPPL